MKLTKKLLSVFCAIACLLACAFVPSAQSVASASDVPKGLTEIYPSDFGIDDGVYNIRHNNKTIKGMDSLLGTIFTMDFRYISGDRMWFMYAAAGEWHGLSFRFVAKDNIFVLSDDTHTYLKKSVTFNPDVAGVDFFAETFRMQISLEAVDNDGLGEKNDLKIGVFFNYKLYGGEYIYQNDTALLLGNKLWIMPLLANGEANATYEISSPVATNSENYLKTVPKDFGIADGKVNTSVEMPVGIDGKYFSVNTALNVGEYINYAGLKLYRENTGALTLLDSTGNNSFTTAKKQLDTSEALTPITYSNFEISNGTYTYNKGDTAVRNSYKNGTTLDGTYFSAKIKFHDGEGSSIADMRYGGNDSGAWTGIWTQFYANKIVVRDTKTNVAVYTFTPADVGLTTFENTEFIYGISIRFVDIDSDGLEDDVQYGIWVNGELVQDKYGYVADFKDSMGIKTALYCSGSASSTDNSTITVTSVSAQSPVSTQENGVTFPLNKQNFDFFTKRIDSDFDGAKDDLKVIVFEDSYEIFTVYVTDYKTKLNNTLAIKGEISSPAKQVSYKTDVISFKDAGIKTGEVTTASGKTDLDVKTKNIVSGRIGTLGANGNVTLKLKQDTNKYVTFSDFTIPDGAYDSTNAINGKYEGGLDGAIFTANINLTNNNPIFYYGGTAANKGIKFQLNNGQLRIYNAAGTQLDSITGSKAGIGLTFLRTAFDLGIVVATLDNDSDGAKDDIKIAIWFNGVYYNTYSVNNAASSFGNYASLTSGNTSKATVSSEYLTLTLENASFLPTGSIRDVLSYTVTKKGSFDIEFIATDLDDDGVTNDFALNFYSDGKHSETKFVKNCFMDNVARGFKIELSVLGAAVYNRLPEESLPIDEIYSLYGDPYLVLGEENKLFVNRTTDYKAGDVISTPGEYVFVRTVSGTEYVRKVALWKYGHTNNDNAVNILDFIAMSRYVAGDSDSKLYLKSGDFDGSGDISAKDILVMKRYLLGVGELPEYTERSDRWSFSEDVMPIVGYYGPLMQSVNADGNIVDVNGVTAYDNVTDKVYKAIAESGVNTISYIESGYSAANYATTMRNLKLASKYGLGVSVNCGVSADATDVDYAKYISKFSHFTSFRGLFIKDEPSTELLKDLTARSTMANKYANLYGYINLYPTYVSSTVVPDYEAYVDEYCSTCNPKMLSWDHYVMQNYKNYSNKTLALQRYFNNLNIIRTAALKHEIPFWGFLQTGDANGYSGNSTYVGTKEEMMWNLNTQLAYGAKGIQYFTLVQPNFYSYSNVENLTFDYNSGGLVGANGEKTQYYYHAVAANKQITAVDHILMNSDSKEILAIGTNAKSHTGISKSSYGSVTGVSTNESGTGWFKTTDGAVVGCFDYNGKEAYYIVNYDLADTHDITVTFNATHKYATYSATQNGEAGSGSSYTASLKAGEAVLIVLD